MGPLLTREQVAAELGVCPTTIYRWETSKKSPIIPKRIKRTRQLRYTSEDVETLRAWMNEVEDATVEQVEDRAVTPA
jgi:DNA-binding XRE family transcriptional regulator